MVQRLVGLISLLLALSFCVIERIYVAGAMYVFETALGSFGLTPPFNLAILERTPEAATLIKTVSVWERSVAGVALALLALGMFRMGAEKTPKHLTATPSGGALVLYDDDEAMHQKERYRVNDRGRPFIVFGLTIVAIFLGGLVAWSVLAPIESAAVASGVVKVESNRLVVDHPDGGTIEKLLVREGDYVNDGQPIIYLDTNEVAAELDVLERRRDRLLLIRARLIAEQANKSAVQFPADIISRAQQDADLAEIITYQRALFDANRAAFEAERQVRGRQIKQFGQQADGFEAELQSTRDQLEIIEEERADLEALFEKGLTPQTRVLALRRERVKLKGQIGSLQAKIAQVNTAIAQSELELLKLEREKQQRISDRLKSVAGEYFELIPRINQLENKLSRHVLRAPAAGIVFGLTKFTIGGVIRPGEKVLEIVPEQSDLVIEIRIDPRDRESVHSGMKADVRITPYESKQLEPIPGTLRSISADIKEDERTAERFYTGQVELSQADMRARDVTLSPGMPAQAMIPLGSRSTLAYLVEPLTRTFERSMREE